MGRITSELIYEALKPITVGYNCIERRAARTNPRSMPSDSYVAMQQDIQNIYVVLTRHERLDRIERRLEIAEAPTWMKVRR